MTDASAVLDAVLRLERGAFTLELSLQVLAGQVVALLGPNGAGKSTALRGLAGLLPLSSGHVRLDGRTVEDTASGLRLPAAGRASTVLFQEHLLFPHLTARDNVAFGLRAHGLGKRAARVRAEQLLAAAQLSPRRLARPDQLSGGQAQRIALIRALAVEPRLLLLDEPLAALDAAARMAVRGELRDRLATFDGGTVLVTHDPLDALILADRLVVIEAGRVVQAGPPSEVASRPRTDFVARLVGLNLLPGHATGTDVALDGGGHLRTAESHHGPVHVALRPTAISLYRSRPEGSPRNTWPAAVRGLEVRGDAVRLRLQGPPDVLADVTPAAVAELRLAVGTQLWCATKATDLAAYPQ